VFDKAKKTEQELKARSETVKQDIAGLKQARAKIDTRPAQAAVQAAEKSGQKDSKFLTDSKSKQESDRKKGEKELEKQKRKMKSAKMTFRN